MFGCFHRDRTQLLPFAASKWVLQQFCLMAFSCLSFYTIYKISLYLYILYLHKVFMMDFLFVEVIVLRSLQEIYNTHFVVPMVCSFGYWTHASLQLDQQKFGPCRRTDTWCVGMYPWYQIACGGTGTISIDWNDHKMGQSASEMGQSKRDCIPWQSPKFSDTREITTPNILVNDPKYLVS